MLVTIKNKFTGENILSGEFTSLKEACELNKNNLRGADLRGAYLHGAYLHVADLDGVKNYAISHDFFQEIVRRQPVNSFNSDEWVAIAQIVIHTLCWESIHGRFNNEAKSIFAKLAKAGFTEWEEYYTAKFGGG